MILAGVYDVRNIKVKIRPEDDHKVNSPWNIAAKFDIDMSFSAGEIMKMLENYEEDHHTGMDIIEISELLYSYTSGYPYLVSGLCKLMDEEIPKENPLFSDKSSAWTRDGFLKAVKKMLYEQSPLFDSLTGKLYEYPELRNIVYRLLFQGQNIAYNPDDPIIQMAKMFGFGEVIPITQGEKNSFPIIWTIIIWKRDICSALILIKRKKSGSGTLFLAAKY